MTRTSKKITSTDILQRIVDELSGYMPMKQVERIFRNVGHDLQVGKKDAPPLAREWIERTAKPLVEMLEVAEVSADLAADLTEAFAALKRSGVQVPDGGLESKVIWLGATAAMFEHAKPAIELGQTEGEPVLLAHGAKVTIVEHEIGGDKALTVIVDAGNKRAKVHAVDTTEGMKFVVEHEPLR